MKTILVPTDFSKVAGFALDFAVEVAYKINAKIILLHAVNEAHDTITINGETFSHGPSPGSKSRYAGTIGDRMYNITKRIHKVRVENSIGMGSIKDVILNTIKKHDVNMVIMGSKGATGIKEILIGSHAEEVIRYAKCPIITIKEPTKLTEITSIMLATDLSFESEGALRAVVEIQKLLGLKLILLTVNKDADPKTISVTNREMEIYAATYKLENYQIESIVAEQIEKGILEAAENLDAGFIAMGTHGRKGLAHIVEGSHAENVANYTHRPLISYQYDDF